MSQHTQDEWYVERHNQIWFVDDEETTEFRSAREPDEKRGGIYVVTVGTDDDYIAYVRSENADKDAQLIAAAPKLLNALKVFTLDTRILSWLNKNDPKALEQALMAIKEATE